MAVGLTSCSVNTGVSLRPKTVTFVPVDGIKTDEIKRLYWGDNLDVMQFLLSDATVAGKVKLIYIDPPYNTGGAFETRNFDYAYNDRFEMDEYLSFIKSRLVMMNKLLANDGSIYVQLDSNMVFHVKILMDEIFGCKNFRGMITRKKCKSKNYTRKTFGNISDYILFYTKSDNSIWNRPYEEWSAEKIEKEYPYVEEETGRRYKKVPIHAPGVRNGATGSKWRGMMPPIGKHWQYTPDKLDEMDARGEIYWSSNGNPRKKVYLDQSKGIPVQDIWLDYLDINNQNTSSTGYPTEKNLEMLKRIVSASSNPGDIVLDCFSGSGTTLSAAEELGRQWIGIDIGEEAIKATLSRFTVGLKKYGDYTNKTAKKEEKVLSLFNDSDMESNNVKPSHYKVARFNCYSEYGCFP